MVGVVIRNQTLLQERLDYFVVNTIRPSEQFTLNIDLGVALYWCREHYSPAAHPVPTVVASPLDDGGHERGLVLQGRLGRKLDGRIRPT